MRLEINEEVGQSISLTFKNDITTRPNGGASINVPTRNCRIEIDFSKALFYSSIADYLFTFQQQVGGQEQVFRFRDPSDNRAESEEYDTELGIITQGVLLPAPDGTRTEFQLFKLYQLGDNKYYRPITRPTGEDLEIFKDAIATTGFTLEDETGAVTFTAAPLEDEVLTWSGSFDIPCRFADPVNVGVETLVYYDEGDDSEYLYQMPNLKVIEVKEAIAVEYENTTESRYEHDFQLDWSYNSVVYPVHSTAIDELDSGFENRINQGISSMARVSTTSQEFYYQNQIEYLIGLYRLCYGTGSSFTFADTTGYTRKVINTGLSDVFTNKMLVRFSQPLTISVLREDESDRSAALFRVGSMELRQTNVPEVYRESFTPIDGEEYALIEVYHVFGRYFTNFGPAVQPDNVEHAYWRTFLPILNWDGGIQITGREIAGEPRFLTSFYEQSVQYISISEEEFNDNSFFRYSGTPFGGSFYWTPPPHPPANSAGNLLRGNTETIHKTASLTDACQAALDAIAPENFTVTNISTILTNLGYFDAIAGLATEYNHLTRLTQWCHCWLITREDETELGFTDHDITLTIDGVEYDCQAGFNGDAISLSTKVEDKNTEVKSFFTATVNEEDVLKGKYRYASIKVFAYDWQNGETIRVLFNGYISDINLEHDVNGALRYTFSAVSNENRLEQKATRVTTRTCPYRFGDADCQKDLTNLTDTLTVTNTSNLVSSSKIIYAPSLRDDGFYNNGVMTFETGNLAGISRDIVSYANGVFTLWQALPLIPSDGDTFTAIAGCDKTIDDCKGYNNFVNFGGQPYIPGTDRLYNGADT
jgi:uncharacterized phage protein (TIGR02218 family)/uncharacterized protein (TIGR02217 family)